MWEDDLFRYKEEYDNAIEVVSSQKDGIKGLEQALKGIHDSGMPRLQKTMRKNDLIVEIQTAQGELRRLERRAETCWSNYASSNQKKAHMKSMRDKARNELRGK